MRHQCVRFYRGQRQQRQRRSVYHLDRQMAAVSRTTTSPVCPHPRDAAGRVSPTFRRSSKSKKKKTNVNPSVFIRPHFTFNHYREMDEMSRKTMACSRNMHCERMSTQLSITAIIIKGSTHSKCIRWRAFCQHLMVKSESLVVTQPTHYMTCVRCAVVYQVIDIAVEHGNDIVRGECSRSRCVLACEQVV